MSDASLFRVREARSHDRYSIGALWQELMDFHRARDPRFKLAPDARQQYIRHAHDMMRGRNARVLVAEETATNEVIGFVLGELQQRPPMVLPGLYGFISDICVRADWRQQGVGRALFEEMRRWFVAKKAIAIELYASEQNPEGLEFWEAMGLEPFLKLMHCDLPEPGEPRS